MKNGRSGMTIFVTIASTICWNSSRALVIDFAFVHAAARPRHIESASALMTDIIGGMSSLKTRSGRAEAFNVRNDGKVRYHDVAGGHREERRAIDEM